MKKLRNKTFYTIFSIFSLFIITILFIFNYQNYHREAMSIETNLTKMNNLIFIKDKKDDFFTPNDKSDNKNINEDLNNKIIMDYEVYTILLDNDNHIIEIINHSDNDSSSNINSIIEKILQKEVNDTVKINNLYFSKYSYNFKSGQFLVRGYNFSFSIYTHFINGFTKYKYLISHIYLRN